MQELEASPVPREDCRQASGACTRFQRAGEAHVTRLAAELVLLARGVRHVTPSEHETAFLFPGQGAQTVGMAERCLRQPARRPPAFRRSIERSSATTCSRSAPRAQRNAQRHRRQPAGHLRRQPRGARSSASAASRRPRRLRRGRRAEPGGIHRPGLRRRLSFADGLRLVQIARRGDAGGGRCHAQRHGQRARAGPRTRSRSCVPQRANVPARWQIANLLCPGNIVVSGTEGGVRRSRDGCAGDSARIKTIRLAVAGAFHTDS